MARSSIFAAIQDSSVAAIKGSKTEAEIRRDALRTKNPQAAGVEQTQANEAERIMKAARRRAIELYALLAADYPAHPLLDEILYYLAYEYEQVGDFKDARTVYYELIQKAPQSKYVPNAYLAFGELFFDEAQGDPSKWDLAAQAYTEVVKYPAPVPAIIPKASSSIEI